MATPPTRVSYHVQSTTPFLSTGTSKTCTGVTYQVGDYLEIKASAEQHGTSATVTPTLSAGAATWTKYADQGAAGANNSGTWSWVGVVTTAATSATVTLARPTGSNIQWGFTVSVIRGSSGIGVRFEGNNGSTSSAPAVTQTVAANSLLTCQINDWNATDGTSRTWRTVNGSPITEASYYRSASTHAVYGGYVADSGAGGSVTMGLTAPATQRWVMSGFEFLGTTSGGTTQAAAGTVPATTTAAASALARLGAAGTAAAATVAATSAAILLGASGVAAASSATSGAAIVIRPAGGTVVATTDATGAAERAGQAYAVAGSVSASSGSAGSASTRSPGRGSADGTATTGAAASARTGAAGTVAASTTTAGAATPLGGPVAHAAAGTVAAMSATSGAAKSLSATAATASVLIGTSAAAAVRTTAAGVAPLVAMSTGAGFAVYAAGGSVAGTVQVTGSAAAPEGPPSEFEGRILSTTLAIPMALGSVTVPGASGDLVSHRASGRLSILRAKGVIA